MVHVRDPSRRGAFFGRFVHKNTIGLHNMTITLYSGTPGSGKSYHATADIRDALYFRRNPMPVICNYDLSHDIAHYDTHFHYLPNNVLTPDWLVRFAGEWWETHPFHEDRILLVIDEAQLLFNSREWQNPLRMAWLQFFSQHRHYGYKVIFIAQSDKMVDRQFRALLEYDCIHRKLSNFGIGGKLLALFCLGRVFTAITKYYGNNDRIGVRFFVLRRRVMRMYDSYTQFKRLDDGEGVRDGTRAQARGTRRAATRQRTA